MAHHRAFRICFAFALVTGLVTVGLGGAAPGAEPAAPALVGLGDSYASGVGTGTYDGGSGDCMRSPLAYSPLVAAQIGASLTFVACSGATTDDVRRDQVGALSSGTTDVTVTVGGNDIGFVDVITTCALSSESACLDAIRVARELIRNQLPGDLAALYADVAAGAPKASVFVVGYPRLFDGRDCSPLTDFTGREMRRLNATANLLDRTTHEVVRGAGFRWVDPRKAFDGHALCDADPWINNVTFPLEESFHPNVAGQRAFADLVLARRSR